MPSLREKMRAYDRANIMQLSRFASLSIADIPTSDGLPASREAGQAMGTANHRATAQFPDEKQSPRGRTFAECLPPTFRARSSSRERARALSRISPDLTAKFGTELQTKDVEYVPGGKRGDVVGDLVHGTMEMDLAFKSRKANVECVSYPEHDENEIDSGSVEVANIFQAMVARLRATGDPFMRADEILRNIRAEQKDQQFKVLSVTPSAKLHATYGVSLADFDKLLEFHPDGELRQQVRSATKLVMQNLSSTCGGMPLSEDIEGFCELILYYMAAARGPALDKSTVHGAFHFMLRSDFHAVYLKLLNSEDRALARVLLLPSDENGDSLLLRTIGRASSEAVFENAYLDASRNKCEGPLLGNWHKSIIHGRGEGRFAKDLMSPPPGYPLHTGNPDKDYGMGQMGVDAANKKILFEIRGRTGRYRLLLNRQLRTTMKLEEKVARQFNPAVLGAPEDLAITEHEENWLKSSAPAIYRLGRFATKYREERYRRRDLNNARRLICKEEFNELRLFFSDFEQFGWGKKYPAAQAALSKFDNAFRAAHNLSSRFSHRAFSSALDELIEILWNIDPSADDATVNREAAVP